MPIEEILDQLDELIDRSWSLPLTGGRCVVDADKVRELLDDVRLNLPTEIRQAQSIVADRTAIVDEAKKEAEAIIARAEKRAAALVEEQEIVRVARKIGTMETSILPYEDCCTVFTPKHPKTKPTLGQLLHAERTLDREALILQALESVEKITVKYHDDPLL